MQKDFDDLINYFGGYLKLEHRIRFKITPHSKEILIYELKSTDNIEQFGDAKNTVIQRLKWLKHLKQKSLQNESENNSTNCRY